MVVGPATGAPVAVPAGDVMTTSPDGPSVKPAKVWVALILVGLGSIGLLSWVWAMLDPAVNTLGYELARILMQVIGVTVIGGVITLATSSWQEGRRQAAAELEDGRRKAAQAIEHERQDLEHRLARQREQFEIRASMLDRSSRCAQTMYVKCQHVARVQAGFRSGRGTADREDATAMAELDEAYLLFNAEAAAVQTEVGARFGVFMADDTESRHPYLLWHQIYDLLTLYYFSLCRDFPGMAFANNMPHNNERHSGLALSIEIDDPRAPKDDVLSDLRRKIRHAIEAVVPALATAMLTAPMNQDDRTGG